MPTLKVRTELARELAWCTAPCADWVDAFEEDLAESGITELVENRYVDHGDWTSRHELVVRTKDRALWRVFYRKGLTEYSDVWPFEDAGSEVEFVRVAPKPASRIEYFEVA